MKFHFNILFALIAVSALASTGCSSVPPPIHADVRSTPTLATLLVSCSTPHRLDQDCDNLEGATRKMELGGIKIRVAGSLDGRVTLIMDPDTVMNIAKDMRKSDMSTHRPEKEKRTVVPLERVDSDMWLNGSNDVAMSLIQLPSLHLFKHGAADPAKQVKLAIES